MTMLEESQAQNSKELAHFDKTFKVSLFGHELNLYVISQGRVKIGEVHTAMKQEEAAKEEKEALEKIAVILSNLTSKKSAMVSQSSQPFFQVYF